MNVALRLFVLVPIGALVYVVGVRAVADRETVVSMVGGARRPVPTSPSMMFRSPQPLIVAGLEIERPIVGLRELEEKVPGRGCFDQSESPQHQNSPEQELPGATGRRPGGA
jgi:hypothetical protein